MEFIKWDGKIHSVGIKEIDNQHKNFIKVINETYEISKSKNNKEKIREILNQLLQFARVHFSTEERYFKKFKYPWADEHIREHEKIIKRLLYFFDQFDKGKGDIQEFLNFLKAWFNDHCVKWDQKYAKYFKKNKLI